MEDFFWETESPLATNEQTMTDFLENHIQDHCGEDFEPVHEDSTYCEIQNDKGDLYGVHASGNGDFCSHRVRFVRIPYCTTV